MLLKNQLKNLKNKGILIMGIKIEIDNQFEIGEWIVPKEANIYIDQYKMFVEGICVEIGLNGYINWLYSLVSSTKTQRIYFDTAHQVYKKIANKD